MYFKNWFKSQRVATQDFIGEKSLAELSKVDAEAIHPSEWFRLRRNVKNYFVSIIEGLNKAEPNESGDLLISLFGLIKSNFNETDANYQIGKSKTNLLKFKNLTAASKSFNLQNWVKKV